MAWAIEYLNGTKKQLRKLSPEVASRIVTFMNERVLNGGGPYSVGGALTGKWSGFWRYRVGDYRVICRMQDEKLIVLVEIGHRSDIY